MSRVGKKPVALPSGVKVELKGRTVAVEGPKGKAAWESHPTVKVEVGDSGVTVERAGNSKLSRAMHGTARQLIFNMVHGVSQGFAKNLEIIGVGYNAKMEGKNLVLAIGFCHPVKMPVPEGLTVVTPKPTIIEISGVDKQLVGQFAAEIRRVRPPEPYKGKGIRYQGEEVRRKAAKGVGA